MPHRYVFKIEYDGSRFDSGWQKQNNGKTSVQGALETAASELAKEQVKFVAAGRTDKHVHAMGQIVHADFTKRQTIKAMIDGMNWYLKDTGCRVLHAFYCKDPLFHARFSAKHKIYEYVIAYGRVFSVFDQYRCWWIPQKPDLDLLRTSANILLGEHDFSSFRDASCQAVSSIRKIDSINMSEEQGKIKIEFTARSFLHKQIRIMVGTLIDITKGKIPDMQSVLTACDRTKSGQTAPGYGLYLREVIYGDYS